MPASPVDPLAADFSYVQVADNIAVRIEAGEITHRLPSERSLAQEYGVAYQTVRHAMKVLRERGLIITRQGRGTFVVPQGRPETGPPE
jgi:DNA-binding GntR family transcriptional regulator